MLPRSLAGVCFDQMGRCAASRVSDALVRRGCGLIVAHPYPCHTHVFILDDCYHPSNAVLVSVTNPLGVDMPLTGVRLVAEWFGSPAVAATAAASSDAASATVSLAGGAGGVVVAAKAGNNISTTGDAAWLQQATGVQTTAAAGATATSNGTSGHALYTQHPPSTATATAHPPQHPAIEYLPIDVHLQPGETRTLHLLLRPMGPGHLIIKGMQWSIAGLVRCRHEFQLRGPPLNDNRNNRAANARAIDKRLEAKIKPGREWAAVRITGLQGPTTVVGAEPATVSVLAPAPPASASSAPGAAAAAGGGPPGPPQPLHLPVAAPIHLYDGEIRSCTFELTNIGASAISTVFIQPSSGGRVLIAASAPPAGAAAGASTTVPMVGSATGTSIISKTAAIASAASSSSSSSTGAASSAGGGAGPAGASPRTPGSASTSAQEPLPLDGLDGATIALPLSSATSITRADGSKVNLMYSSVRGIHLQAGDTAKWSLHVRGTRPGLHAVRLAVYYGGALGAAAAAPATGAAAAAATAVPSAGAAAATPAPSSSTQSSPLAAITSRNLSSLRVLRWSARVQVSPAIVTRATLLPSRRVAGEFELRLGVMHVAGTQPAGMGGATAAAATAKAPHPIAAAAMFAPPPAAAAAATPQQQSSAGVGGSSGVIPHPIAIDAVTCISDAWRLELVGASDPLAAGPAVASPTSAAPVATISTGGLHGAYGRPLSFQEVRTYTFRVYAAAPQRTTLMVAGGGTSSSGDEGEDQAYGGAPRLIDITAPAETAAATAAAGAKPTSTTSGTAAGGAATTTTTTLTGGLSPTDISLLRLSHSHAVIHGTIARARNAEHERRRAAAAADALPPTLRSIRMSKQAGGGSGDGGKGDGYDEEEDDVDVEPPLPSSLAALSGGRGAITLVVGWSRPTVDVAAGGSSSNPTAPATVMAKGGVPTTPGKVAETAAAFARQPSSSAHIGGGGSSVTAGDASHQCRGQVYLPSLRVGPRPSHVSAGTIPDWLVGGVLHSVHQNHAHHGGRRGRKDSSATATGKQQLQLQQPAQVARQLSTASTASTSTTQGQGQANPFGQQQLQLQQQQAQQQHHAANPQHARHVAAKARRAAAAAAAAAEVKALAALPLVATIDAPQRVVLESEPSSLPDGGGRTLPSRVSMLLVVYHAGAAAPGGALAAGAAAASSAPTTAPLTFDIVCGSHPAAVNRKTTAASGAVEEPQPLSPVTWLCPRVHRVTNLRAGHRIVVPLTALVSSPACHDLSAYLWAVEAVQQEPADEQQQQDVVGGGVVLKLLRHSSLLTVVDGNTSGSSGASAGATAASHGHIVTAATSVAPAAAGSATSSSGTHG